MNLSNSDKISLASAIIAALGFVLVIGQLRLATIQHEKVQLTAKARLLSELHERASSSEQMASIFQKIEYGKLKTNIDFHDSKDQRALIQLLSFFELLGQLEALGMLGKEDIAKVFGYYITRTYKNDQVTNYLTFLKNYSSFSELPSGGVVFPNFERIAKRILDRWISEREELTKK